MNIYCVCVCILIYTHIYTHINTYTCTHIIYTLLLLFFFIYTLFLMAWNNGRWEIIKCKIHLKNDMYIQTLIYTNASCSHLHTNFNSFLRPYFQMLVWDRKLCGYCEIWKFPGPPFRDSDSVISGEVQTAGLFLANITSNSERGS